MSRDLSSDDFLCQVQTIFREKMSFLSKCGVWIFISCDDCRLLINSQILTLEATFHHTNSLTLFSKNSTKTKVGEMWVYRSNGYTPFWHWNSLLTRTKHFSRIVLSTGACENKPGNLRELYARGRPRHGQKVEGGGGAAAMGPSAQGRADIGELLQFGWVGLLHVQLQLACNY